MLHYSAFGRAQSRLAAQFPGSKLGPDALQQGVCQGDLKIGNMCFPGKVMWKCPYVRHALVFCFAFGELKAR